MTETELKARFNEVEVIARGQRMSAREKELVWQWLKEDRFVAEVCGERMDWEEFKAAAVTVSRQFSGMLKTISLARHFIPK
jgi:benzoyl-CoA reductase/2-hydroxyglutaryl-CoA dehydratase subunit BcrC/BadD/HgdB